MFFFLCFLKINLHCLQQEKLKYGVRNNRKVFGNPIIQLLKHVCAEIVENEAEIVNNCIMPNYWYIARWQTSENTLFKNIKKKWYLLRSHHNTMLYLLK